VDGVLLTTSAASYYTAPTSSRAVIQSLTVTNSDVSSSHWVTVYLVQSGQAPGPSNMIADAQGLSPLQTWRCDAASAKVLRPGGAIWAYSDVGNLVNLQVSGVEVA
jgi:hypothetical protein